MIPRFHRPLLFGAGLALTVIAGCDRQPQPVTVDGVTYGTTNAPFRGRWWHHYERGVSWAMGGFLDRAEADFRACLRLRRSDSRRARTYGFHFVQCFVHRELAAVIIERGGDLDEARRLLERSLAQEPSAKAQWLLQRLDAVADAEANAGLGLAMITPTATPDGGEAPPPPRIDEPNFAIDEVAVDRPPMALASAQLQIDTISAPMPAEQEGPEPAAQRVAVSGRLDALEGVMLVALGREGAKRRLATAPDGGFTADLAIDEALAITTDLDADPIPLAEPAALPAEPSLALDGPGDGAVVNTERLYYRYTASAESGLKQLQVRDQNDTMLTSLNLDGIQRAGTLAVPVSPAITALRFSLSDEANGEALIERALTVRPPPQQQRKLRAVAYLVPLQSPEDGAGVDTNDDPLLQGAVVENGRFRVLDQQADELLQRELQLVEAGYVDRTTAAQAGQRLAADYVVVGTVRRGRGDLECYLRLIHSASGTVVAIADAYIRRQDPADDARFFELLAGRLRQTFPVIDGKVPPTDETGRTTLTGPLPQARERMRFYAIEREPDLIDEKTGTVILPGKADVVGTLEAEQVGEGRVVLRLIDGRLPAGETEVVSE